MESKRAERPRLALLPDIAGVLCVLIFTSVVLAGGEHLFRCGDTLWHIKAGSVMLEQRGILTHDVFSHTAAGRSWMAHEWLAEIIMALVHQAGGLGGVAVFFSLVTALTFWLLMRLARHYADDVSALLCTLVAFLLALSHLLARPHLFTWLLCTLTLYILTVRRDRLFLLPLITLVWANLHAGFFFGLLLQGVFIAGLLWDERPTPFFSTRWREVLKANQKPVWILLLCIIAAMVNPFGPALFLFPIHVTGDAFIAGIGEWRSPDMSVMWAFRLYVLLIILLLALRTSRIGATSLLLLLFFLDAAFRHGRHVSLAGILLTPLMVELVTPWTKKLRDLLPSREERSRPIALARSSGPLAAVAGAAAILLLAGTSPTASQRLEDSLVRLPRMFSKEAVDYLAQSPPPGQMFNEYSLGGFLIYALDPPLPVFIDGRADMYGEQIFSDHRKISSTTQETVELLDQYEVDWIIFPWRRPLVRYLKARGGWEEVFRDDQLAILVRSSAAAL